MFCPQCSQQQVSREARFCSRCGFSLNGIGEIAANDNLIPQFSAAKKEKKTFSQYLNLRAFLFALQIFSLLLIFFSAVTDAPEEVVTFLFGVAGGVFFALLASLFLANNPKFKVNKTEKFSVDSLNENRSDFALPPQTSQPASSYAPPAGAWKTFTTNDLAAHGVTDRTTKLLSKDE